jgi:hypothetical protein
MEETERKTSRQFSRAGASFLGMMMKRMADLKQQTQPYGWVRYSLPGKIPGKYRQSDQFLFPDRRVR